MNEKESIKKYPLLIGMTVMIFAMLLGYIFEKQTDFSDMENRFLAKKPSASAETLADGSFMTDFETYTNEQIPLRNQLVKAKSLVQVLIGRCENNSIAKGKDGYLFDKTLKVDDQYAKNVDIITEFIWNSGRKVTVAVAPTSTGINSDKLPNGMPVLDEKQMNEYLLDALSSCDNAGAVDLFGTFEEYSSEDLYYKTDHHWKTMTAYYAYCDICKSLDITPVDVTSVDLLTANDFYGTFYAKYKGVNVTPDTIEYLNVPIDSYETEDGTFDSLLDFDKLKTYDKYAMFMHGNFGKSVVNSSNAGDGKSLIVFKDSYANCLIPFLAMNYDTIIVVDLRYLGESAKAILEDNPNADILMLYNYSFINDDKHFYKLLK